MQQHYPLDFVVQQRKHVVALQLVAPFKGVQFDHKSQAADIGAERLRHLSGGLRGAAGCQQVITDDDAFARLDRVLVHFQRVVAVFQFVLPLQDVGRQLLRLAHRNEARVQAVRKRRPEDESARLNAQHQVDVLVDVVLRKRVDEAGKAELVFEQRGDVVEENARFRKARNFADELLEVVTVVLGHWLPGSFDAKRWRLQQRRSGFADLIDARRPRALLQLAAQRTMLLARARRHHFNIAILAVAYPSGYANLSGFALHGPAKAYALHAPGDDVTTGLEVSHEQLAITPGRGMRLPKYPRGSFRPR